MNTVKRQAYWIRNIASSSIPSFPQLQGKGSHYDVAVVGSGITGLSCALKLQQNGKKVAIIEASKYGQGVTLHTTGKITSLHRLCYDTLKSKFDLNTAKLYAQMNEEGIDIIKDNCAKLKIDAQFTLAPHITYSVSDNSVSSVKKEYEACKDVGFKCDYLEKCEELPFPISGALKLDNQAHFNSYMYMTGLIKELQNNGCDIYEDSRVVDISFSSPHTVQTEQGYLSAENVVIATHLPILDRSGHFASCKPKRSYGIAVTLTDNSKMPKGMYISTGNEGYENKSIRPAENGTVLIIGGNGHNVGESPEGNTESQYKDLIDFAKKFYPVKEILCKWSSHDYIPNDFLPYIGYLHYGTETLFTATGFKKWGFTQGAIAGNIISDLIVNGKSAMESNAYAKMVDARRWDITKSIKSATQFQAFVSKHFIGDRVKHLTNVPDVEDLANDTGGICKFNGKVCGAYKDTNGKLHMVDNKCTHLDCLVNWNQAERTFDCPCHGSRYSFDGEVLHGPSVKPLKKIESDKGSKL